VEYSEAISYLFSRVGLGKKFSLGPMRAVLSRMGDPHTRRRVIHVAGTNGKTSTSRIAGQVLVTQGYRTGVFTSPHLQSVEERIAVDGRPVSPSYLALAISEVAKANEKRVAEGDRSLTYFEITTAAALDHFVRVGVDAMVLEVGLGGRLDATNVVSAEVAVLTGLAFDHTEYLGDTIQQIAGEKLGIVGPGARLVCGSIPSEAAPVVERRARSIGAEVMWLGKDFGIRSIMPRREGGWVVSVDGLYGSYQNLLLPLRGRHQIRNLAVAVAAAESWMEKGLDVDRLRDGMAAVSVPGRMELVDYDSIPILLDGAHNPEACSVLAKSLSEEFGESKWVAVLGVMGDKDLEPMIGGLAPYLEAVVASRADSSRAMKPAEISRRIRAVCDLPVVECDDPSQAVGMASRMAGANGRVLVTGSLYLVGEVRTLVGL
jgi:dihydrofolate synthase/folylpolyglutamate synthase